MINRRVSRTKRDTFFILYYKLQTTFGFRVFGFGFGLNSFRKCYNPHFYLFPWISPCHSVQFVVNYSFTTECTEKHGTGKFIKFVKFVKFIKFVKHET
jgi:hypothetical protein